MPWKCFWVRKEAQATAMDILFNLALACGPRHEETPCPHDVGEGGLGPRTPNI